MSSVLFYDGENMKIEDFFKEINNGKLRGAQAKLARDLHTSTATTNRYFSGEQVPSEQAIKDLAHIYKKSEEEIKEIFNVYEKEKPIQHNVKNKDCQIQQIIGNFEAELIKEKLKSLEAKLDLLIQLAKEGK